MNQLRHRIDQEFPEAIRIDHCGFFRPSGFTSDLPVTFNSKKPSFPHVSRVEREARKGPWAPCGLSSVPARSFDVFNDDDIFRRFFHENHPAPLITSRRCGCRHEREALRSQVRVAEVCQNPICFGRWANHSRDSGGSTLNELLERFTNVNLPPSAWLHWERCGNPIRDENSHDVIADRAKLTDITGRKCRFPADLDSCRSRDL